VRRDAQGISGTVLRRVSEDATEALQHTPYAKDVIAAGRVAQLLPGWSDETFPLYVYHHTTNLMSAKVRAFLEFVRELAS
jgi:DNA-binding transcriptional LysR family regulator